MIIRQVFDGQETRWDIWSTKGDAIPLNLKLIRKGMNYDLADDDSIRVAISEGFKGDFHYKLIYTAPISTTTLSFTIPSNITERFNYRAYNYDIELTHGNGDVDTVVKGKLIITGESA